MKKEILWYLERIEYYGQISTRLECSDSKDKSYRIFGEIESYSSLEGIKLMHDFWVSGLIGFVEEETKRRVNAETSKYARKLQESENMIRELVELTKDIARTNK